MAVKISQHDKRVLTMGIGATMVILAYVYILAPWAADWSKTRAAIAANRKTIDSLQASVGKRANQATIVPVLTMPITAEKQQHLFKTRMNDQLNAAGIQVKSLQYVTVGKATNSLGFTVSKLKCDGKGGMSQVAKLMAGLGENPYLLGVDELHLSCDSKKRDEITVSLTVSTFCKND
jgi:hypothetical protein